MDGRDRRLDAVLAKRSASESLLHERDTPSDLCPVPERSILLFQQDYLARR
jgi:hypothetical protein